MKHAYSVADDQITETSDDDALWIRFVNPAIDELEQLSEKMGFDHTKLLAALDTDEPSQYDEDEETSTIIIDVPYKTESGVFNTNPMGIVLDSDRIITASKDDESVFKRFNEQYHKYPDCTDNIGFLIRLLLAITREYQVDLKEIDSHRRSIEAEIRTKPEETDLLALHTLENTLVYLFYQNQVCNILILHRSDKAFHSVR